MVDPPQECRHSTTSTDIHTNQTRKIYQPLHPEVRHLLDPEYVAFHDRYIQFVEPEQNKPWDGSARTRQNWPYAGRPIVEVGRIEDIQPDPNFKARVFTPAGHPPAQGWPVVLWLHGGGFASGDIAGDNDLCSLLCRDANCVVVSVGYRLAPEHPYPAAIEDVTSALVWIHSGPGAAQLSVDRSRIAIGGASAGANIATVVCLAASDLQIPLKLQILVVPVIDQTATLATSWAAHAHAPWLTPARMIWYRQLYIADSRSARDWQISPCFAPTDKLQRLPKTFIAIANQDMLSTEGLAYAEQLQSLGVAVDVKTYDGMPHGMMALAGESAMGMIWTV